MRILLVEGRIEGAWMQDYVQRYGRGAEVIIVQSMAAAAEFLGHDNRVDVVILSDDIPDILAPTGVSNVLQAAPDVPFILLETGKTLHPDCFRRPGTRLYHLKTDVSRDTFFTHITNIVAETRAELAAAAPPLKATT